MTGYSAFRLESDVKKGGNNGLNQQDLTSTIFAKAIMSSKKLEELGHTVDVDECTTVDAADFDYNKSRLYSAFFC